MGPTPGRFLGIAPLQHGRPLIAIDRGAGRLLFLRRRREWHFLQGQGRQHLSHSRDWQRFVDRFSAQLTPLARPRQPLHGVLEEARVLAAHAGIDTRSDAERAGDPQTILEKTFRTIESMVMTVLNEHPGRQGNPVRFDPVEGANPSPP